MTLISPALEHPTGVSDTLPGGSYDSIHRRIAAERGVARTMTCALCPNRADQWAFNHTISDTQHVRRDATGTYSLDVMSYIPLCMTCHRTFDAGTARTPDVTRADLDTIRSRTW